MKHSAGKSRLSGELSARQIFSLGFGTIIGVGWVIVLGEWLSQAGPVGAILSFLASGLLMITVGLCYAEMASMLPASGGEVAYAYEVFGPRASFFVGWFLLLVWVSTTTFEAISVGWLTSTLIPGSEGMPLYSFLGSEIHLNSLILGLAGMLLLTVLNYRGAREAAYFQEILTFALLVATAFFVVAGIGWGSTSNLRPFFQEDASGSRFSGMLAVFVGASFFLGGFNVIPQVMEERKAGTSSRLAARTILLSLTLAVTFYVLVILSAALTVPWVDLVKMELPAARAFQVAFDSEWMAKVVLGVAFLGLITTWNAVFIAGSRVLFSLGRARMVPAFFARVHPVHHTPSAAVIFIGVIGSLGTFLGKSAIVPIVNIGAVGLCIGYLTSCFGVFQLRRRQPERRRPYRVPAGTATSLIAAVACCALIFVAFTQPYTSGDGTVPLEWIYLGAWSILGLAFWVGARTLRSTVNEEERRMLILGGALEADEDNN